MLHLSHAKTSCNHPATASNPLYAGILYADALIAALASAGDSAGTQPAALQKAIIMVATLLPLLRIWRIQRGKAAVSIATQSVFFLKLLASLQTILAACAPLSHGCATPALQPVVCSRQGIAPAKTTATAGHSSEAPDAETFCALLSPRTRARAACGGSCMSPEFPLGHN